MSSRLLVEFSRFLLEPALAGRVRRSPTLSLSHHHFTHQPSWYSWSLARSVCVGEWHLDYSQTIGGGARGVVNFEPGAIPDANEIRAGQGLANAGYDVSHQPTANSQGIPDVRTADLSINGVGQVDVYTPQNTSPNGIVRNIEGKFDQANGVVVQANLSEADMTSVAARRWGKPNGNNFNTIFFQNSSGQVFRFDRPTLGK